MAPFRIVFAIAISLCTQLHSSAGLPAVAATPKNQAPLQQNQGSPANEHKSLHEIQGARNTLAQTATGTINSASPLAQLYATRFSQAHTAKQWKTAIKPLLPLKLKALQHLDHPNVQSFFWHPDKTHLVTVSEKTIKFWDTKTWQCIFGGNGQQSITHGLDAYGYGHPSSIKKVAQSPDHTRLAVCVSELGGVRAFGRWHFDYITYVFNLCQGGVHKQSNTMTVEGYEFGRSNRPDICHDLERQNISPSWHLTWNENSTELSIKDHRLQFYGYGDANKPIWRPKDYVDMHTLNVETGQVTKTYPAAKTVAQESAAPQDFPANTKICDEEGNELYTFSDQNYRECIATSPNKELVAAAVSGFPCLARVSDCNAFITGDLAPEQLGLVYFITDQSRKFAQDLPVSCFTLNDYAHEAKEYKITAAELARVLLTLPDDVRKKFLAHYQIPPDELELYKAFEASHQAVLGSTQDQEGRIGKTLEAFIFGEHQLIAPERETREQLFDTTNSNEDTPLQLALKNNCPELADKIAIKTSAHALQLVENYIKAKNAAAIAVAAANKAREELLAL